MKDLYEVGVLYRDFKVFNVFFVSLGICNVGLKVFRDEDFECYVVDFESFKEVSLRKRFLESS